MQDKMLRCTAGPGSCCMSCSAPHGAHIVAAAVQEPEQHHSVELEEHVLLHRIQPPLVLHSILALLELI